MLFFFRKSTFYYISQYRILNMFTRQCSYQLFIQIVHFICIYEPKYFLYFSWVYSIFESSLNYRKYMISNSTCNENYFKAIPWHLDIVPSVVAKQWKTGLNTLMDESRIFHQCYFVFFQYLSHKILVLTEVPAIFSIGKNTEKLIYLFIYFYSLPYT